MVALLGQLWWRVPDETGPLHQGTRQQVERGGQPALPCHGQETIHSPGLQPAAVWPVDDDPVGASESKRSSDAFTSGHGCFSLLTFVSNLSAIFPPSVTVSVWVPVWLRSTDTLTAATQTPPKSLTGCAAEFQGEFCERSHFSAKAQPNITDNCKAFFDINGQSCQFSIC